MLQFYLRNRVNCNNSIFSWFFKAEGNKQNRMQLKLDFNCKALKLWDGGKVMKYLWITKAMRRYVLVGKVKISW